MQFDYILINFAPLTGLFFLLLFLHTHSIFDRWCAKVFRVLTILELVELAVYSLELWTSTLPRPTMLRVLLSAVGYTVRPVMLYGILLICERQSRHRRAIRLLAIPLILNAALAFSAFFTDIVYTYDAGNAFVRGPLGYCAHAVLLFYLAVLLVANLKKTRTAESLIIVAIVLLIAASIFIEAIFDEHVIARSAMVISTIFYYMYFQTQVYQQDIMQHMEEENRALQANKTLLEENLQSMSVISMLAREFVTVCYVRTDVNVLVPYRITPAIDRRYGEVMRSGVSYDEVFTAYVGSEVCPEDQPGMLELNTIGRLSERIGQTGGLTYRYRVLRDGATLYCEMRAEFAEREDGGRDIVLGFSNNDAEVRSKMQYEENLRAALRQAEAANRAKTAFLSNMSHDIRTPMNAIIGFTALASTHIDNKEQVRDYLGKITQSSNHLLSLINDVLDMSRIESGKMNIDEKPENLSEILHSVKSIVQADVNAKQMEFFIDTVDCADEDVVCDRMRLCQVLLNLLSNAIKFSHPGGMVSLRLRQKAVSRAGMGEFEFIVRDNGIGMSPGFLSTLFDPFTRERNSTVSGIPGTGLGMSITKSIVELMGGTIEVRSEAGKGTEATVTLSFRLQGEPRAIQVIRSLEGLRGLVADDNGDTCQSVCQMLRQIGMRAEWTMYGKEAVIRTEEALKIDDPYHVYIVDWLMPDMNGIEIARRIRRLVGDDAPIIILSAYDWADVEEEARQAGVTGFISKPLFPSDLRRVLMKACGEMEERTVSAPVSLAGRHVLLAEDNELNREIACSILEDAGLIVVQAENGEQALGKLESAGPFDLVLMDIQMPVMDGYEATRRIRALPDEALARIPIIAMTANAFDDDRRQAFEAGMDGFVPKPLNIEALWTALHDALETPQGSPKEA